MLPDRVSNPGPLTYESGTLPIALRGPAWQLLVNMPNSTGTNLEITNIESTLIQIHDIESRLIQP